MNARRLARQGQVRLAAAGVPDADFESELLLRTATGLTRAAFFMDPCIDDVGQTAFVAALDRRVQREPASYITGEREFYGLPFKVGPGVLIPRPETELLVDLALRETEREDGLTVADVGTGSGCIAVTIGADVRARAARVVGVDVSVDALAIARVNGRTLAPSVQFLLGDLLTPLREADVVLANLPYIPSEEIDALEPEVSRWEPRVALNGGADGFDLIRRLVDDCAGRIRPRLLALEVGFGQATEAAAMGRDAGAEVSVIQDLSGIDRVVCLRWA
jgi:release factor glutamine methyltransferase